MKWDQQFEVITEIAEKYFSKRGLTYSQTAFENLLGLSRGKLTHWKKGQRPSSGDLEMLAKTLGLSPRWLLTGEGNPEGNPPMDALAPEEIHRLRGDRLKQMLRLLMDISLDLKNRYGNNSLEGRCAEDAVQALNKLRSALDDRVGRDCPELSEQELNSLYYPRKDQGGARPEAQAEGGRGPFTPLATEIMNVSLVLKTIGFTSLEVKEEIRQLLRNGSWTGTVAPEEEDDAEEPASRFVHFSLGASSGPRRPPEK